MLGTRFFHFNFEAFFLFVFEVVEVLFGVAEFVVCTCVSVGVTISEVIKASEIVIGVLFTKARKIT
jgi:hypothetical protein